MLSNVVGQERAKQQLYRAFRNDRVAHAYLLAGEEGLGAEELALEAARFFMCSAPDSDGFEPCGSCASCRKVSSFQHPDVHYYFPTLKSTSEDDIREFLDGKAAELYTRVKVSGGSIHIGDAEHPERDSVRGLLREMSLRSFEGQRKLFVVTFIEEMNAEAANALLKILEEPPEKSLYFLTTTQLHRVLPTIVSRCQVVKLHPASDREIEQALVERKGQDVGEAHVVARLSDGNYGRALHLLSGELTRRRDLMLDFLVGVLSPDVRALPDFADTLAGENRKDRSLTPDILALMLTWFQDLLYVRHSAPSDVKARLTNQDKMDRLQRFLRSFPQANIEKSIIEIEKAVDLLSRNIYLNLVLLNLGLSLRKLVLPR
jgi:DNA polymerase-3 subunit delta'